MTDFSLLDLLSPVLAQLDHVLRDSLAFAPIWRIAVFAALGAATSMFFFKRFSNQAELATLKQQIKAVQMELVGEQVGLKKIIVQNLALSGRQLWLSFWPALLASIPLLFLLVFCSNQFGAEAADTGSRVYVKPIGLQGSPADYRWQGVNAQWDVRKTAWTFYQPAPGQTAALMRGDQLQLSLPTAVPGNIIHQRHWWNYLIANPAGYLDASATIGRFEFNTPAQVIINWGPGWMRGWLFAFLLFLVLFSVAIKIVWKIQ
jgi:hypothetical protein